MYEIQQKKDNSFLKEQLLHFFFLHFFFCHSSKIGKKGWRKKNMLCTEFYYQLQEKRNKISFSVTFACEYHVVACLSIDHPLKLYIEKRVEQANLIMEFDNTSTIIKLGRINYRIRIDSENEEWIGDNEVACRSCQRITLQTQIFSYDQRIIFCHIKP